VSPQATTLTSDRGLFNDIADAFFLQLTDMGLGTEARLGWAGLGLSRDHPSQVAPVPAIESAFVSSQDAITGGCGAKRRRVEFNEVARRRPTEL
jgi:hypothetical protein